MPTIRSKKYESYVHYVTVEQWQVFKDKGLDRRYKIIDEKDIQDTVIETPQSFIEPISLGNEKTSREDLKAWLTKHDIEFNTRATTDKLYLLYVDNQYKL